MVCTDLQSRSDPLYSHKCMIINDLTGDPVSVPAVDL